MTDRILDWAVVVLPTLLGILGLLFSLRVPPESTHRKWRYSLLIVGVAISGLIYWQQSRSRTAHEAEIKEHREANDRLHQTVEALEATSALEFAFIRERLDSKELAALSSAIRDYARRERAGQELSNKQLRQRAVSTARRMREFQLRYDFEQSEINRRWLRRVDEVRKRKATTLEEMQKQREELTKIFAESREEDKALSDNYVREFTATLLAEAAYVRDEILRRLPPRPEPTRFEERMQVLAFQGVLITPRAVGSAADYLEDLVKKL